MKSKIASLPASPAGPLLRWGTSLVLVGLLVTAMAERVPPLRPPPRPAPLRLEWVRLPAPARPAAPPSASPALPEAPPTPPPAAPPARPIVAAPPQAPAPPPDAPPVVAATQAPDTPAVTAAPPAAPALDVTPRPLPYLPALPKSPEAQAASAAVVPTPAAPTPDTGPASSADAAAPAAESAPRAAPAAPPLVVDAARLDAGFRLLRPVEVAYPELARRLRRGGTVELEVEVTPDGRVARVAVLAESGSWGFGRAARTAYREARFTPPTVAGRPVRVLWHQQLRFEP